MRLKSTFFCLIGALIALNSLGQTDFNNYKLLRSQSPIPDPILKLASEKAAEELNKIKNQPQETSLKKSEIEDFSNISNYEIDKLLKSGKVLFNDEITKYVERVAKRVLAGESGVSDLHFFTVRSAIPNAFATSSGYIFINIGLIARLHTEEELAFVICHEFVHIRNTHGLLGFENALKLNRMASKESRKGNFDKDEWLIRDCLFSKEQESEADEQGMQIYLKSAYGKVNPIGALEVLKFSDFPIVGDAKYNPYMVESANFKVPDAYKLPDSSYHSYSDTLGSEDDQRLTHPNLNSRIQKLKQLHSFQNSVSTNSTFEKIKKIAEFESTYWLLAYRDFEFAIAQSNYLLTKYPNNSFLKSIHQNAWFGFAITCGHNDNNELSETEENTLTQGPYSTANYLLKNLGKHEIDAQLLALRITWNDLQKNPTNVQLQKKVDCLIYRLTVDQKVNPTWLDTASTKAKKKSTFSTQFTNFYQDIQNPEALKKQLKARFDKGEPKQREKSRAQELEEYRNNEKYGFKLGAKNVLVFDPMVYKIDFRDEVPYQHLESEIESIKFLAEMEKSAKELNLNLVLLGGVNNVELDKLEEGFWLNLYFSEFEIFDYCNGNYVSMFEEPIQEIRKKYKSDYVLNTYLIKQIARRSISDVLFDWLFASQQPLLVPIALFNTFTPEKQTDIFFLITDLNNHKKTRMEEYLGGQFVNKMMNYSHLYDILLQIKNK